MLQLRSAGLEDYDWLFNILYPIKGLQTSVAYFLQEIWFIWSARWVDVFNSF